MKLSCCFLVLTYVSLQWQQKEHLFLTINWVFDKLSVVWIKCPNENVFTICNPYLKLCSKRSRVYSIYVYYHTLSWVQCHTWIFIFKTGKGKLIKGQTNVRLGGRADGLAIRDVRTDMYTTKCILIQKCLVLKCVLVAKYVVVFYIKVFFTIYIQQTYKTTCVSKLT